MPDISYEALAGAALVIVLAVGYQYLPKADDASGPGGAGSSKSKKKNKKKAKGKGEDEASGSASEEVKKSAEAPKAGKGKKDKAAPTPQAKATPTPAPPPITPSTNAPSFAEVAAEETEEKPKPKTLAQKIAPKNRKSKVDDMLAPEDRPAEHARVMKVVQNGASKPAPAESEAKQSEKIAKYEDDYQEGDDTSGTGTIEDDGWDVVPSKKKKTISISNSASPAASTSAPLPVETKIQRKNAKKADDKKAIKDAEEADRLKRLAQHKKGLEKERITEIYKSGKKGASGKTNGGAFASLDTNGKLVWE